MAPAVLGQLVSGTESIAQLNAYQAGLERASRLQCASLGLKWDAPKNSRSLGDLPARPRAAAARPASLGDQPDLGYGGRLSRREPARLFHRPATAKSHAARDRSAEPEYLR